LSTLANSIKTFVQPIFEGLRSAFNKIKATVIENKDEFQAFFDVVKAAAPIIGKVIGAAFNVAGTVASTVLNLISNVLGALKTIINTAIDGINLVIRGLNLIKPGPDIASIGKIGSSTGSSSTGGISVPRASLPTWFQASRNCYNISTDCDTPTPTANANTGCKCCSISRDSGCQGRGSKSNDAVSSNLAHPVSIPTWLAGIMAASGKPSVVINVNSDSQWGIDDKEGFTRALNNCSKHSTDSYFRGTGGATGFSVAI
jgi:hypothetical protein